MFCVLRSVCPTKDGEILSPVLSQFIILREKELSSNRKINDIDKEIARLKEQNLVLVRLQSKGYADSALFISQADEINYKLTELLTVSTHRKPTTPI